MVCGLVHASCFGHLLSYVSVVIANKFCDFLGYRSQGKYALLRFNALFTLEVATFLQVPPLLLFSGASAVFGGKSPIYICFSKIF